MLNDHDVFAVVLFQEDVLKVLRLVCIPVIETVFTPVHYLFAGIVALLVIVLSQRRFYA